MNINLSTLCWFKINLFALIIQLYPEDGFELPEEKELEKATETLQEKLQEIGSRVQTIIEKSDITISGEKFGLKNNISLKKAFEVFNEHKRVYDKTPNKDMDDFFEKFEAYRKKSGEMINVLMDISTLVDFPEEDCKIINIMFNG